MRTKNAPIIYESFTINNRNLASRSKRGGIVTIISQLIILLVGLVRGGIMARFLTPYDYGLQGMVLAFLSFALIFKDLGLSTATIRENNLSQAQVSNLFWINTLIGLMAALITIAAGPFLSIFYKEPVLTKICLVLSVSYLLAGLNVQSYALLQRDMKFSILAIINISSNIGSSLLGIFLAWRGYGYWSLVYMQIATNLFTLVGSKIANPWVPSKYQKNSSINTILKFGGTISIYNIISTVSKHFDSFLLGKLAGAEGLGIYNRALQPVSLVENQLRMSLSGVALPAMSSIQTDKKRFLSFFYKFVASLAFLSMPVAVYFFIFAKSIILYYLGPGWEAVVPIFKVFSISIFFTPVILVIDRIPLALGNSAQYLKSGIVGSLTKIVCVALGASLYGAYGAAVSILISNLIMWVPWYRISVKGSGVSGRKYVFSFTTPLIISIISGIIALMFVSLIKGEVNLKEFIFLSLIYWFVYALFYLVVDLFSIGCDLGNIKKLKVYLLK